MNTFKRKSLYAALAGLSALGVTGAAQAVNVNPDGLGQVLLYPYYTVRSAGGSAYNTLFSVVNSTGSVKAVKVRMKEGKNSREVLDWNVYLSPYDVWTAAIIPTASGAAVKTSDGSCTAPAFPSGGQEFRNLLYTGSAADGSDPSLDRTREGYFEIIEMGVVTQATATAWATHGDSWARLTMAAAVPLDATVPMNCPAIQAADANNAMAGWVRAPSGGLFGGETLVNVLQGTDYTQDPTALDAWSQVSVWADSSSSAPNLYQVNPRVSTVFASYGSSLATELIQTTWPALTTLPADPVSAVLMHDTIMNEYVVDPTNSSAGTDWVITFPTKTYYYSPWYLFSDGSIIGHVNGLFQRNYFDGACDDLSLRVFDREERSSVQVGGFSPQGTPVPRICWETNVITFNNSAVLGSGLSRNVAVPVPNGTPDGWMRIGFPVGGSSIYAGSYHTLVGGQTTRTSPSGAYVSLSNATYYGLPSIGFAVHKYTYNNMPTASGTVLSNYGGNFVHKGSRSVTGTQNTIN